MKLKLMVIAIELEHTVEVRGELHLEKMLLVRQPVEHFSLHQKFTGEPLILPAPKGAYRIHLYQAPTEKIANNPIK